MNDIFISYAREDEKRAKSLQILLESEGWDVWLDTDTRVGKEWKTAIDEVLDQSKAVVVLWTRAAVESDWVSSEADHALRQEKIFPVLLEDCTPPERFTAVEMALMSGWSGRDDHPELLKLMRSLGAHVRPRNIRTVRPGFDSRFFGDQHPVGWPSVHGSARQLHDLHFSVVMNPARRLAWYVAYNVDMTAVEGRGERRQDHWMPDTLVAPELQPANHHFEQSGYDRGHLAARSAVAWGPPRQAAIAGRQAFFWTNTAPQHEALNRGAYLAVERWERKLSLDRGRVVVFAGPVLADDDPLFRDEQPGDDGFIAFETFRVPRAFWKVVATLDGARLAGAAFHFQNPGLDARPRGRPRLADLQIELSKLQDTTRLDFPQCLHEAAVLEA